MYKQTTTQFGAPEYTTSGGDVVYSQDGRVYLRVAAQPDFNSLGFQHHNPSGAAQVLAAALENAYLAGQQDAKDA